MEIFYSKRKLLKGILLGLLGSAASFFVLFKGYQAFLIDNQSVFSSTWTFGNLIIVLLSTIPLAGLVMFGGATVIFIKRFFIRTAQVIINEEGIEDKRLNTGLIRWSEVLGALQMETDYAQWVSLILSSPEKYFEKLPTFEKFLRKANGQIGNNNLRIRFTDLDTPIDEAFPLIEKCVLQCQNELPLAE